MKLPGIGSLSPSSEPSPDSATVLITVNFPKIGKDGRDEMRKDAKKRCEEFKTVVRLHRAWAMQALKKETLSVKKETLSGDKNNDVKTSVQHKVDRGVDLVTQQEKEKGKELLDS